jgi:hypothetical protein
VSTTDEKELEMHGNHIFHYGMLIRHLGLVNASVFTTAMQVASRFLLVWAICDQFPFVPANSIAYSTMLIAWSTTEVIRYSYFVCLLTGSVPEIMQFLRYISDIFLRGRLTVVTNFSQIQYILHSVSDGHLK